MVGTRGIPAAYSGFETAVEHLAERFTARGHEVTVYCRPHMTERRATHAGARLVHLPTVRSKHLDTLAHTLVSTAHLAARERPDVALYFIAGNAPAVPLARLAGIPAVLQIDGLDSERAKWSGPARAYLRMAERIAPAAASLAVTDSRAVADAYEERYGRRIAWIPYGAELARPRATPGGAGGWASSPGGSSCSWAGWSPRTTPTCWWRRTAGSPPTGRSWSWATRPTPPTTSPAFAPPPATGVRFPGYVFGDGYAELVHRCGVMCVPTEVGGTHPVIVEGMAAGAALLVSDHPPNVETVGDAAADLPAGRRRRGARRGPRRAGRRRRAGGASSARRAAARARERYSWDACADAYLRLCELGAGALRASRRRGSRGRSRAAAGRPRRARRPRCRSRASAMPTSGSSQAKPRSSSGS